MVAHFALERSLFDVGLQLVAGVELRSLWFGVDVLVFERRSSWVDLRVFVVYVVWSSSVGLRALPLWVIGLVWSV